MVSSSRRIVTERPAISSDVIKEPQYALSTATPLCSVWNQPIHDVIFTERKQRIKFHHMVTVDIDIPNCDITSPATMFISSRDNPPKLFTIQATLSPGKATILYI